MSQQDGKNESRSEKTNLEVVLEKIGLPFYARHGLLSMGILSFVSFFALATGVVFGVVSFSSWEALLIIMGGYVLIGMFSVLVVSFNANNDVVREAVKEDVKKEEEERRSLREMRAWYVVEVLRKMEATAKTPKTWEEIAKYVSNDANGVEKELAEMGCRGTSLQAQFMDTLYWMGNHNGSEYKEFWQQFGVVRKSDTRAKGDTGYYVKD